MIGQDPAKRTLAVAVYNKLTNTIGLRLKLRLVEPKSITRSEGKAKRVIDKRQL